MTKYLENLLRDSTLSSFSIAKNFCPGQSWWCWKYQMKPFSRSRNISSLPRVMTDGNPVMCKFGCLLGVACQRDNNAILMASIPLLLMLCTSFQIHGVPGRLLFKESIYLSFWAHHFNTENSFEKVIDCSFCTQKCRIPNWTV